MIKTSLSTHAFAYNRLDSKIFSKIAEAGFDSVELYMHKPHFNFDDVTTVQYIKEVLNTNGLTVNSIHCPFYRQIEEAKNGKWLNITSLNDDLRKESVEWIKRAISLAEMIPYNYAVLHFGDINDINVSDLLFRAGAESIEMLVNHAEQYHVAIALENIPNKIATSGMLINFIEQYGFKGKIVICIDTGHAAMEGDVVEKIQTLGKLIKTVHLHDTLNFKDEHLPPGEGILEWKKILSALKEINSVDCLTLENKWNDSIEKTISLASKSRKMLKKLWRKV
jgi:sugar phosphate isomerase/epimerase